MSKGEEKSDALVLRELGDTEVDLNRELRTLREREEQLGRAREEAEADFRKSSANPQNPYLWGEPEKQAAHVTVTLETLRAGLEGAVHAHEAALRLVRDKEREIERNQVGQERAIAILTQRQNLRLQWLLMFWTAVVAVATIASLFK
jgi:hypothetical protein